jgi:hypothetical protein
VSCGRAELAGSSIQDGVILGHGCPQDTDEHLSGPDDHPASGRRLPLSPAAAGIPDSAPCTPPTALGRHAEIGVDTLPDLDRVLGTIRAIDGIRSSATSILLASM